MIMKIQGTYKNFEQETFTITLSYKDIVDLDIELNCLHRFDEETQSRAHQFAKMIAAAVNERYFGIEIKTMYV